MNCKRVSPTRGRPYVITVGGEVGGPAPAGQAAPLPAAAQGQRGCIALSKFGCNHTNGAAGRSREGCGSNPEAHRLVAPPLLVTCVKHVRARLVATSSRPRLPDLSRHNVRLPYDLLRGSTTRSIDTSSPRWRTTAARAGNQKPRDNISMAYFVLAAPTRRSAPVGSRPSASISTQTSASRRGMRISRRAGQLALAGILVLALALALALPGAASADLASEHPAQQLLRCYNQPYSPAPAVFDDFLKSRPTR